MIDFKKGVEAMDRPEILYRLFFPRRTSVEDLVSPDAVDHFIEVAQGISVACRFYPARTDAPNILYFHGNGEIAADYDYVAPVYQKRGLNLFVADYRGYGLSGGTPSCSAMIRDAHPTFEGFTGFLLKRGYRGGLFVMGRSLGSAPAIEVAYHYHGQIEGLIVESGFASGRNQLARLGVADLFEDPAEAIGFGNDLKIKEIPTPTLIIHGDEDEIIPADEGHALYTLSGATEKSSLFIPYAGHNDLMLRGLDSYMGAIERFVRDRVSAGPR